MSLGVGGVIVVVVDVVVVVVAVSGIVLLLLLSIRDLWVFHSSSNLYDLQSHGSLTLYPGSGEP